MAGLAAFYAGMDTDDGLEVVDASWQRRVFERVRAFGTRHVVPMAIAEYGGQRDVRGLDRFLADRIATIESLGFAHVLWVWQLDQDADHDMFALTRGPDPRNHSDVANPLSDVVFASWSRNLVRPCPF